MSSGCSMEVTSRAKKGILRPLGVTMVLLCGVVCVACNTTPPPKPTTVSLYRSIQGDDLASIHLATVLVWPWDNVSRDIQPKFSVNVGAPNGSIALTSEAQSQYSQSSTLTFGAQYGVAPQSGLPPSSPSQGA